MNNKLVGIFVSMLLIVTIVPTTETNPIKNEENKEIIWISSHEFSDAPQNNQDLSSFQPIDWLHFDNGTIFTSLGLQGGGIFEWAARFTPTELNDWSDYKLSVVRYYHSNPGSPFDMDGTVKIYAEGNETTPGDLISTEDFTAYKDGWTYIELSEPVFIDGDMDIWVSIEGPHFAGEYPAGMDEGPVVYGKGDWTNINGSGWIELWEYGYNNNFMIWAGVSPIEGTGPIPILDVDYNVLGLGGISVVLKNSGEGVAYNITWNLRIDERIWYNKEQLHGTLDDLGPYDSMILRTDPILGIGRANMLFICNYTMELLTVRDELDGGVKEDGVDVSLLLIHTFPPNQNPEIEWRTLNENEYKYVINSAGKKSVDFILEPPQPNKLHQVRVYNPGTDTTTYTGICKLTMGEGQLIEDWITQDDVLFGGATWQVEKKP
jgi:hypothetical protein